MTARIVSDEDVERGMEAYLSTPSDNMRDMMRNALKSICEGEPIARAIAAERERGALQIGALKLLAASVRSVVAELGPGESLRPAGATKTNILISDLREAERVIKAAEAPKE